MPLVRLIDVPHFRTNSQFIKDYMESFIDMEKGSLEWLKEMTTPINMKYFTPIEHVTSLIEFIDVINTSDFLNDENPISVYIYAYMNKKEVLQHLVYNNVEELNVIDNNFDITKIIRDDLNKDFLGVFDLIYDITYDVTLIKNREKSIDYIKNMKLMNNNQLKFFINNTKFYTFKVFFLSCDSVILSIFCGRDHIGEMTFHEINNFANFVSNFHMKDNFEISFLWEDNVNVTITILDDLLLFDIDATVEILIKLNPYMRIKMRETLNNYMYLVK